MATALSIIIVLVLIFGPFVVGALLIGKGGSNTRN